MTIEIEAIKRMAEAATEGPWKFVPWHIEEGPSAVRAPKGWLICTTSGDPTAEFIAAARSAVPELIARVERLEAKNERLREYAHAATKAISDLAGGGSELFAGKIGDMFIADLPYCINRVRERHDMIHRQLVGEVRKRKEAEEALVEANRKPVWEVPL